MICKASCLVLGLSTAQGHPRTLPGEKEGGTLRGFPSLYGADLPVVLLSFPLQFNSFPFFLLLLLLLLSSPHSPPPLACSHSCCCHSSSFSSFPLSSSLVVLSSSVFYSFSLEGSTISACPSHGYFLRRSVTKGLTFKNVCLMFVIVCLALYLCLE